MRPDDGGESPFIKCNSKKVRINESMNILVSEKQCISKSIAESSFFNEKSEQSSNDIVLETAKDKLRMATIERKRMNSINAVGDRRFGGKTIDNVRKEDLELQSFI